MKNPRKTLRAAEFPHVEECLYEWFLQERRRHTPMSGEILKEKAKVFYKKITKKEDFCARKGWLEKFKKRFGIRLLSTTGEKLSCNVDAFEPYKEKFKSIIADLDLTADQVYNAEESSLFWRLLPKKTYVNRA